MKFIVFLLAIFVLNSCNTCHERVEAWRPRAYDFIVHDKFQSNEKYYNIVGKDLQGKDRKFFETGWSDLYAAVQPGDTLLKIAGKLDMMIGRKSGRIYFHFYYDGEQME